MHGNEIRFVRTQLLLKVTVTAITVALLLYIMKYKLQQLTARYTNLYCSYAGYHTN